jgi:hypothetical protein
LEETNKPIPLPSSRHCCSKRSNQEYDLPRTRTWNLRLRRPTPYPLGQQARTHFIRTPRTQYICDPTKHESRTLPPWAQHEYDTRTRFHSNALSPECAFARKRFRPKGFWPESMFARKRFRQKALPSENTLPRKLLARRGFRPKFRNTTPVGLEPHSSDSKSDALSIRPMGLRDLLGTDILLRNQVHGSDIILALP